MPDKNEIERRKQIAKELKLKAKQEFDRSLPTSRENLKSLFDYLDEQLADNSCDHSQKHTIHFTRVERLLSLFRLFRDPAYSRIILIKILREVYNILPSAYRFVTLIK